MQIAMEWCMVQSYMFRHCSHDMASLNFFDVMGYMYVTQRPKQEYVCRRFKFQFQNVLGQKTGCELSKICYLYNAHIAILLQGIIDTCISPVYESSNLN